VKVGLVELIKFDIVLDCGFKHIFVLLQMIENISSFGSMKKLF